MLVGMVVTYGVGFHMKTHRQAQVEHLAGENTDLGQRIQQMAGGIAVLKTRMEELTRRDEMLRILADLPEIDPDIRQMGIGGPGGGGPTFTSRAAQMGLRLDNDISKLTRQAALQRESFEDIESRLAKDEELRKHLPSIWPVRPSRVYVSSYFGYRRDPFTNRRKFHQGLDLAGRRGTDVYATADGVVALAKARTRTRHGLGKEVRIDHQFGYRTVYGHLQNVFVRAGQTVKRGQRIGAVGSTGRTTGPHLHYGVFHNGRPADPINYLFAKP
jgi:murein DD-endopeptidase MepM/ murein hydrolase activator NlpD